MKRNIILMAAAAIISLVGYYTFLQNDVSHQQAAGDNVPARLSSSFPEVDFSKNTIDLSRVLSGGPGRDGIPALSSPPFISLEAAESAGDEQGILVEFDEQRRFYPFRILVWHEIVNDSIGDNHFAVTFCPLCGSSIVFDREVDGKVLEFGVSGFLYESNMIMFNRQEPISLWSQTLASAIAGNHSGQALQVLPSQVVTLQQVRDNFPEVQVLSDDTGFNRDYSFYPYGDYESSEELLFDVSVDDNRYPAKEIFYIIPFENSSVALRISALEGGQQINSDDLNLQAVKNSDGTYTVRGSDGNVLPGYFEMWFSWATHHQDDGAVWDPNKATSQQ